MKRIIVLLALLFVVCACLPDNPGWPGLGKPVTDEEVLKVISDCNEAENLNKIKKE